jgi:DeoR/GlpR family transcriptional regulator of sugar metabolism
MLDHGEPIKTKEICERFKISERTLRRDIKILKEVDLERPIYFDPEEGYFI